MKYTKADYYGRTMYEFELDGRAAKLVIPENPAEGKPWLLKTEYFWAFPSFELAMLERGFYVAYVENKTRWHHPSDDVAKHSLNEFLQKEFGLNSKCIPVGMSCGGLQAIYYANKFPEDIAGLYLDAPVCNFLSCPGSVGASNGNFMEEFTKNTGMTLTDLINYRNHPIDNLDEIIKRQIPVFLVCGDSDNTVPFLENGAALYDKISNGGGKIEKIVKEGCDHHPHGLDDPSPLVNWALSLY